MTTDRDALRYERGILQEEVKYRRDRRIAIFTWANSILIAVTGGVIALQSNSDRTLGDAQKVILSSAVLVLGVYSALWWNKQRLKGQALRGRQGEIDLQLGIDNPDHLDGRTNKVGGLVALIILTVIAITAIWVPVVSVS